MSISVALPALGESVVEGPVARWLVAEGEAVERDQPLVEVTTDKVDAEIPSPAAGVIEKILVAEGETVAVGAQLAVIGSVSRAAPEAAPGSAPSAAAEVDREGGKQPGRATGTRFVDPFDNLQRGAKARRASAASSRRSSTPAPGAWSRPRSRSR